MNGLELVADEFEVTAAMFSLAAGDNSEDDFPQWLRAHVRAVAPGNEQG